jgi:hypothetical protein
MADNSFTLGDNVLTNDALTNSVRGTIIDVRATPSGKWVYGVEDAGGAVSYFTGSALRLA